MCVCTCVCVRVCHMFKGWPASHVEFSVRLALFGMLPAACFLMSRRWMSTGVNVPRAPLGAIPPFQLSLPLSPSFSISIRFGLNSDIPPVQLLRLLISVFFSFFFSVHQILLFVSSGKHPVHLSSDYLTSVCFIGMNVIFGA